MAVTADNSTLVLAESYGNILTAFDIAADGTLSNRRPWADLGEDVPDGICLDAEGAVWYADVPHQYCVRVREGGEVLQTIKLDRGCFACMLGGAEGGPFLLWPTNGPGQAAHVQSGPRRASGSGRSRRAASRLALIESRPPLHLATAPSGHRSIWPPLHLATAASEPPPPPYELISRWKPGTRSRLFPGYCERHAFV